VRKASAPNGKHIKLPSQQLEQFSSITVSALESRTWKTTKSNSVQEVWKSCKDGRETPRPN